MAGYDGFANREASVFEKTALPWRPATVLQAIHAPHACWTRHVVLQNRPTPPQGLQKRHRLPFCPRKSMLGAFRFCKPVVACHLRPEKRASRACDRPSPRKFDGLQGSSPYPFSPRSRSSIVLALCDPPKCRPAPLFDSESSLRHNVPTSVQAPDLFPTRKTSYRGREVPWLA